MTATTDTKVWAYSRKGTRLHAMLRTADNGTVLVAACRGDISRGASAVELRERTEVPAGMLCTSCVKRHDAYLARVEASMAPATESHDLGYVHPVTEPVTDYVLPGSLVDLVYGGIVVALGAELIEDRAQCRVTVRATVADHRATAARLDRAAETVTARHQAARYGRWAYAL